MTSRSKRPPFAVWTEAEDDYLRETYPDLAREVGKAEAAAYVATELKRRRLSRRTRTPGAVRRRAHALKVRVEPPRRDARTLQQQALDAVRDFRGLPLSYPDLEAVLGIRSRRAKEILDPLVETGDVERVEGMNGEILYRDPRAWRETAA